MAGEALPQPGRGMTQVHEVVVLRQLQALELAPDREVVAALEHVIDARMGAVGGAEDGLGLGLEVESPDVADGERRQHHALRVAQRQLRAGLETAGDPLGDVEGDGNRPQRAVGQSHTDS